MKLNSTPRHYMPLSQSQSDDDESVPSKQEKRKQVCFKNSYIASNELMKDSGHVEIYDIDPKTLPMTPLRKLFFIFSLMLCFLFIVIFVFLAPCTKNKNHHTGCHMTKEWESVLHNMSFLSPLDFARSSNPDNYIIILSYINDETGLIAIEGATGKEQWRLPLHSIPTSSMCNIIDVNTDGFPECIIIGDNGLLTAVDLRTGTSVWYLHNHSDLRPVISVDRPMLMPDCDKDDVYDLFISYVRHGDNITYLAVVSGSTGQVIGSFLELSQCKGPITSHFMWKTQNDTDFILHCNGRDNGNLWLLSSKSVCDVALNKSSGLTIENVFRVPKFGKDIHFYKVSSADRYLALVMNGNEVMLLEKLQFGFRIVWKNYFVNHHHIRILTDGQFSEGSYQLVILSTYFTASKVIGVSLKNGKEVWTIIQEKGNVTAAMKLPMFFTNSDGLILKVVSSSFSLEESNKSKNDSLYAFIGKKLDKNVSSGGIIQLKEIYVLVKPEKIPIVTVLNTEEIWSLCEENVCQPDVYSSNATVLISTSKIGVSVDMLAVSSTLNPKNKSVTIKDILIKYWNLENICYISSCTI